MSTLLESLLDDERRANCRANDMAMAMGRPVIVSQPVIQPVRRPSSLHWLAANVATRRWSPRTNP